MPNSLVQKFLDERARNVTLIENYAEAADREERDLSEAELQTIDKTKVRIAELDTQIQALATDLAIADDVQTRVAQLAAGNAADALEYRDAGSWLMDQANAIVRNDSEAQDRLARSRKLLTRVAAHMVTSGGANPGALPDPILGPLVNLVDGSRPFVSYLGTSPIPAGPTFHRPRIVDANVDTRVTVQAADKDELTSQEFSVERDDVSVASKATYLNLSKQWLDWATPDGMQMVLNQMGVSYARTTEFNAVGAAEATTATPITYAFATNTDPAVLQAAIADAKLAYYTAMGERATWLLMGPDGEAHFDSMADANKRPAFPYLTPVNSAGQMGANGFITNVQGLAPIVSYAVTAAEMYVGGPSALELYEQRWETMSVVEPSVAGVQVAVGGYFTEYAPNGAGIIPIHA